MSRECDRRPSGEQKDADAMRRQRVANAKPGGLAKQLKVESASKVSKAKQEAPEVSRQRLKLLIKQEGRRVSWAARRIGRGDCGKGRKREEDHGRCCQGLCV